MIRLSGRLRSALIIGGQGIRARKLRTLLSMLSLFLGVLAVVVVQAGSEFAQKELLADSELSMAKDGTLQMWVPPHAGSGQVALDTLQGRGDAVAALSTQATIGEPGVSPVNPGGSPIDQPGGRGRSYRCDSQGNCKEHLADAPPGKAIELNLTALTGDIRVFRPFRPESGQWLDFGSAPALAPRIVLNKEAAKGFNRYQVPAQMRIPGNTADSTPQIVGVVDDGGYGPAAYIRVDELLNWLPADALSKPENGGRLQVLISPAAPDVEQTLKARLVALGIDPQQIYTDRVNSRQRVESQLSLMRLIFLGMAALVLLIGTAGILNVGLATVGERVEEFALRRAVGTPRMLLAGIVLAETLLTGLMTAAAAIGAGAVGIRFGASMFGSRFPSLRAIDFPWQAGVAGVIAGLVAGLLGGLIPAIRAARIPIATVMRA
ncbi:putative ABC transport system permease protein [Kibdelosporangium banguiense]|uniref:ABC transport system permease protein n=1 Tax=Kibdelosporangium banguiense TaxID=1365924 RepID=A0ABS4TN40_9PSEU|nr:ABC transporter permease [Kibdelosporangium banguiense]MBP2325385.1 putative ABC transport system permease protein [Kibdelosporangium banguiense]